MLSPLLVSQILTLEMETFQGGRSGGADLAAGRVIDEHDIVDDVTIDLFDGLLQCLDGVVCRHDDNDPLAENHAGFASRSVIRDQISAAIKAKWTR